MCSVCVYTAASGVAGLRAWLQTRRWTWLTRRRLSGLTALAILVALGVATVSF